MKLLASLLICLNGYLALSQVPTFTHVSGIIEHKKAEDSEFEFTFPTKVTVRMLYDNYKHNRTLQIIKNGSFMMNEVLTVGLQEILLLEDQILYIWSKEKIVYGQFILENGSLTNPVKIMGAKIPEGTKEKFYSHNINLQFSSDKKHILVYDEHENKKDLKHYFDYTILNLGLSTVKSGSYTFERWDGDQFFKYKLLNNLDIIAIDRAQGLYEKKIVPIERVWLNGTPLKKNYWFHQSGKFVGFSELNINGSNCYVLPKYDKAEGLRFEVTEDNPEDPKVLSSYSVSTQQYLENDHSDKGYDYNFMTDFTDFKAAGNYQLQNGHQIVLFEKLMNQNHAWSGGKSVASYSDGFVVVEVNSAGKIVWVQIVEKKHQQLVNDTYIGTFVKVIGNEATFFFNDKSKNYSNGNFIGVDGYDFPESPRGSVLTFVKMDFTNHKTTRSFAKSPIKGGCNLFDLIQYDDENSTYVVLKDKMKESYIYRLDF